jgi:hypothetical protein
VGILCFIPFTEVVGPCFETLVKAEIDSNFVQIVMDLAEQTAAVRFSSVEP